jgi:perosamine synthetase
MVLTDSKQICEHLKLIRSHGRPEGEDYFASSKTTDYVELGYNWRLSNILAALGVSQLAKIEKAIKLRQDNAAKITRSLSKLKEVVPPYVPPRCRHVYQMYTIKVNGPVGTRDELQQFLTSRGIATKVYFAPVHLTGFYRSLGHRERELPQTEELSKKVLTLPMYPRMTDQELEYITSSIKEFFQARN